MKQKRVQKVPRYRASTSGATCRIRPAQQMSSSAPTPCATLKLRFVEPRDLIKLVIKEFAFRDSFAGNVQSISGQRRWKAFTLVSLK